jgi:hypothetical protein
MARHVVDAIMPRARANLWRFARMACGCEGRLYLEFLTSTHPGDRWPASRLLAPRDPDRVSAELEAVGGLVVSRSTVVVGRDPDPDGDHGVRRTACRLVISWQR